MQIVEDVQLDFSDVLIKPRRSTLASRKDAEITREYKFKWANGQHVKGTGIMQSNMGTIGNFNVSRKLLSAGLFACLHKHHRIYDLTEFYTSLNEDEIGRCFISIGLRDKDYGIDKIQKIHDSLYYSHKNSIYPPICIDVPNGYIPQVKELVIEIRDKFPDSVIMVGNVVTGDITEDLILSGADIVKVGIGNGAQCITRRQTGCGRPQFSAIVECADAAHQVGGMICADGGITCPGDIGKAFGAGADFIMIGSLFAGTDEADGDVVSECEFTNITKPYEYEENDGEYNPVFKYGENRKSTVRKYKKFYGMSSTLAQEKFGNGKPSYRASEGRVTMVPYVGSIDGVIEEFLGGLRSTMTYLGASRLKDIPKCCVFYKVHNQLNNMYEKNTIGK